MRFDAKEAGFRMTAAVATVLHGALQMLTLEAVALLVTLGLFSKSGSNVR